MKHSFRKWLLCASAVSLLSACCHHSHRHGGGEDARMVLTLRFPSSVMPDYRPDGSKAGNTSGGGLALRAVVELHPSGAGGAAVREIRNPRPADDGSCAVSLDVEEGIYDLYVWTDYAADSDTKSDNFYDTFDLRAVAVKTAPYRVSGEGKNAVCAYIAGLDHSGDATELNVYLQWPLAKYRLVATDLGRYNELRLVNPADYPAVDELSFEIHYEYFLPTSFDVAACRPNDSSSGISYISEAVTAPDFPSDEARMIGGDVVLADNSGSFVSLTIIVRDGGGKEIRRMEGIRVDYRRAFLTTVTGNFLTAGQTGGGVEISTDWDEDIVVRF